MEWRKSTYSGDGNSCVEVADRTDLRYVRDSKLGIASPVLVVDSAQWCAFTATVKAGRFE